MPDEVIADRYELEELVGTGGMSSVYKARDRLLERNVALKILHPHYSDDAEYVERFRREARSVAQLSHPHIVTVIDRGEDGGQQFIVFEFVDGENLKQLIGRSGPLPVRRAIELSLEIAVAVAMKHINEPPPDLYGRRPDVPLRLVAAVERALEKDPSRRFASMDELASELRRCLVDTASAGEERTVIATSPMLKESRPHRM